MRKIQKHHSDRMPPMKPGATIFIVLVLLGLVSFALNPQNFQQDSTTPAAQERPRSYAHTELGRRCKTASVTLATQANQLEQKVTHEEADLRSEIALTESQIQDSARDSAQSIENSRSGFAALYEAGGMSHEEYTAKMIQLDQFIAAYGTPPASTQIQLEGMKSRLAQAASRARADATDMRSKAATLDSCSRAAEAKSEFSPYDIRELETLINEAGVE